MCLRCLNHEFVEQSFVRYLIIVQLLEIHLIFPKESFFPFVLLSRAKIEKYRVVYIERNTRATSKTAMI
jgi:hypothetical protein